MEKNYAKDNNVLDLIIAIAESDVIASMGKKRQQLVLLKSIGFTMLILVIGFLCFTYIHQSYVDYRNTMTSKRTELYANLVRSYNDYKACANEVAQLKQQLSSPQKTQLVMSQKFKCSLYSMEFASNLQLASSYFQFSPQSKVDFAMMAQVASDPMNDEIQTWFAQSAEEILVSLNQQTASLG